METWAWGGEPEARSLGGKKKGTQRGGVRRGATASVMYERVCPAGKQSAAGRTSGGAVG